MIIFWIFILSLPYIKTDRAGITHCSTQTVGSSSTGGSSTDTASEAFMMQDPAYQFQCCGVVKTITYSGAGGSIDFFTWRQQDATDFKLISKQTYSLTGSPFTTPENMRASFREGDLFGWKPAGAGAINYITSTSINLNWVSTAAMPTTAGTETHPWYTKSIKNGREYLIKIGTDESTAPFFRNLPVTLKRNVNDLQSGGVTLMTLSYDDIDPDDKNDLTLTMSPEWGDFFELDPINSTSAYINTVEGLAAGTYSPVFRVEEDHCGKSTEKTLTLIVTDESPKITNLPAYATVHEDVIDETLLYTVTLSDPADQGIWCKGDWVVGSQATSKIPFIVKMLSTTGGSSEAGIYLIEYPQLDFGSMPFFDLTVKCTDTFGTTVMGKFWVNIIENQPPIFRNLGNMVEVDARTAGIGYTVFTISARDAESDQITYTCSNCGTKFAVFDSGEVQVAEYLLDETDTILNLSITASDLRATSNASILVVYIRYTNTDPVLTNVAGTSKTVAENTAMGTSLYQMSATDVDTIDTLTYFMTVTPEQGNDLFEMSSSGELTTHSNYSINYELLAASTFTLTIYVNDGKSQVKNTLTVTVNNTNEAPYFIASEFIVIQNENDAALSSFTDDPGIITAEDPDNINAATDTLTYYMDCGTYDAYLAISSSTGRLSFPAGYDLDNTALNLPTYFQCTVYVNDTGGLSDNATLHVNVEYTNDNSPSFTNPTYAVTVNSDTPMGYSILQVSATDVDVGDGSTLTYTISSQTTPDLFIIKRNELNTQIATIYANNAFVDVPITGTQTLTIVVSDGLNTNTATVTVTVSIVTVVVSATTDRSWEFIEDPRNATWLSMSAITMATCIFIIFCTVVRCCMQRKRPFINFNLKSLWPKGKPKRKIDAKGRPMPFGRQVAPQYRHVHANEVLRQSPDHLASPTPDDVDSLRPGSGTSGRITVTDVHVKDKEPSWMDGTSSPVPIAAPVKSVAHARTDDWEYLNPNRRSDTLSPEQMYGSETVTPGPSSVLSNKRRHGSRQATTAKHVPVSPSPVQFDNTGDDDDFRSERISIASPSSQLADESEPTY